MTDLHPLSPATAAAELRRTGVREFLGLDPVTQNDALLAAELTRRDARVFRAGDALVASAPNAQQPRQAFVATTVDDPAPVRALLDFLRTYHRRTSFLALVAVDAAAVAAFTGAGFTLTGTLREHRYAGHAYHDLLMLVKEEAC
jgi:hypothetical protein